MKKVISTSINTDMFEQLEELRARFSPGASRAQVIRMCLEGYFKDKGSKSAPTDNTKESSGLVLEQVLNIIEQYQAGVSPRKIAQDLRVSYRSVLDVLRGRSWRKQLSSLGIEVSYGPRYYDT